MSNCSCEVYCNRNLVGWIGFNRTAEVLGSEICCYSEGTKNLGTDKRCDCGRPPVDVVVYNSFDRWWTDGKACLVCGAYLGNPFPLGVYETGEPRTAHEGCPDFLVGEVLR